ncbi:MAG: EamA family transporter [Chloroflexi bacterium]|nr:EamA family transporter [Chloroflexota bacterium]
MLLQRTDEHFQVPAVAYFLVSAIFHYLGPAFAVLLFARLGVLGVAWLRIASAAVIFALWRHSWRFFFDSAPEQRRLIIALGTVLGIMNASFYVAISYLPLGTVGAIEFVGQILLAAIGISTRRNILALVLAVVGGGLLTNAQLGGQSIGLIFAFVNCALFMLYIVLGHRIARDGGRTGIDRLTASMLVAFLVILPVGFHQAVPAFSNIQLLLAGIGVGICSSVIPYITDQLAMARLPRATFALMLSLLPAIAVVIGAIVLTQIPSGIEIIGVSLIMGGVAIHQPNATHPDS